MSLKPKEVVALEKKSKVPMEHFNIGEFNRGQSSKLIRGLSEKDKTAFVLKNGKPIAVVLSYKFKWLARPGAFGMAKALNECHSKVSGIRIIVGILRHELRGFVLFQFPQVPSLLSLA